MSTRRYHGAAADGDIENTANWMEGILPVDGDDAWILPGSGDINLNLDQSAVFLASLHLMHGHGNIGSDEAYLQIGADVVDVGEFDGTVLPAGATRVKLDLVFKSGHATTVRVHRTGESSLEGEEDLLPVRLLLDDPDAEVHVRSGRVAIAGDTPGETSVLNAVRITREERLETDAEVLIGAGVTLATLDKAGGTARLRAAATAVRNAAGVLEIFGAGAIGSLTVEGGTVYPESTGLITNLYARGGLVDATRSREDRTVTNAYLGAGGSLAHDPTVLALTNGLMVESQVTVQAASA